MKIYNGGSDKDELLITITGNSLPLPVTSMGNQMFIIFMTDGSGVGKGFSAIITFGIWFNHFTTIEFVFSNTKFIFNMMNNFTLSLD